MKTCFVSCHYPPLSRTYRRYQFARLLADGGCDVEVVAYGNVSKALGSFIDDPDMMEDDPEIRVHRPAAIPWHLAGEFLYRTGLIPCSNLNWLFTATRTAASIVQSTTDAVLGIYPPVVNHLAAARAAQRTGAKLVLDFRDEYLGLASGVRRPWARLCEKRLVEKADLISVATEELGKRLMERYHLPEERIHLTLNGYWQEVKEDLTCPDRDIVRIVYVGAISAAQRLELLCQAVEILVRKKPQLAGNIEVCIYGPDNLYMRKNLLPLAKGRIQYGGFLGMSQVSSVLLDADVCFLSLASPDYAYAIPGKLYEYIAHARPILGALPEGSARRLIEKEGFGLVANCGDARELAQLLERMLNREVRSGFHQRLVEERHHYAARPHFLSLARKVQELR